MAWFACSPGIGTLELSHENAPAATAPASVAIVKARLKAVREELPEAVEETMAVD
ncbi:hypothetical protein GCM10009537_08630 [Corynebacterium riegelii]